ncbi:exported hypothetical protein [Verrucomicrobia bacterium]|nr:exported hypothetical protein [Verrucomicrobiota bacterium]
MNSKPNFTNQAQKSFNRRVAARTGIPLLLLLALPAAVQAQFNPTFSDADWVSLGGGMDNGVAAFAVSGTKLYAGGGFNATMGGVSANEIAKWDGSAWSALGSGMYGYAVYALAVSGTNLYAGGYFTTAGGVPATNIAKWDGSTWSALGSGMGGDTQQNWVNALAVSGTNLYAGGSFSTAGGVPATNIAKWDGSAWSALGSGLNGYVEALAVSGTDLYAGQDPNHDHWVPGWRNRQLHNPQQRHYRRLRGVRALLRPDQRDDSQERHHHRGMGVRRLHWPDRRDDSQQRHHHRGGGVLWLHQPDKGLFRR